MILTAQPVILSAKFSGTGGGKASFTANLPKPIAELCGMPPKKTLVLPLIMRSTPQCIPHRYSLLQDVPHGVCNLDPLFSA